MRRVLLCTLLLIATTSYSMFAKAEVKGIWVTTDRTIDCSSYESIKKDVLKPDMSDEEKAIAMYNFFRQMVYHYKNLPESREPLKTVNMIGNTLCGSQATCMKGFLESAGLDTRVVSHPGHTFYEVKYGDKWHGFDTMTNFYVYTRGKGKDRTVASFAELNKDPSLIKDAIKENRMVGNVCPCGDKPEWFSARIKVLNNSVRTSDWSVKDNSLRLGEEFVRSWWPEGKPLPGSHRSQDPGPLHTCGSRDRQAEPSLFKFWEPYGIPKFGPSTSVSYRHYFNGQINYSPDLTSEKAVLDGDAKLAGLKVTPNGLTGNGTYTFSVNSPFYLTSAVLLLEADCTNDGSKITVSVDDKRSKKFSPLFSGGEKGLKQYRVALDKKVTTPSVGRYDYNVQIELTDGVTLKNIYLRSWFVHNAMAAPHLMPGKNKVHVEVASADALKTAPLTLAYAYKEAPKWNGETKTIEQVVKSDGDSFEIDIPQTEKLPQMRSLTLRFGKLAWSPTKQSRPDHIVADFPSAVAIKRWTADNPFKLNFENGAMVVSSGEASSFSQVSLDSLKEDWSEYKNLVVELENLAKNKQLVVIRVRSNGDNKKRTDIQQEVPPGKFTFTIPVKSLRKTDITQIDKVYVLPLNVPASGAKILVKKIYCVPDRDSL